MKYITAGDPQGSYGFNENPDQMKFVRMKMTGFIPIQAHQ